VIFGYVDMTVYFNEKKYQQLGFMHSKVDVIIYSKNESIFDFSRLRTTIYNWKNKHSLNSHKRYLSFKKGLFFPSKLLEAPTIPLNAYFVSEKDDDPLKAIFHNLTVRINFLRTKCSSIISTDHHV
jgi:hypothetical protein